MTFVAHTRSHPGPTCQDVNQFLADYLDGTLTPTVHAAFEAHLARCCQCRAYLDQYRVTIDLVRTAGRVDCAELPEVLVDMTLLFLKRHA